MKQRLFYFLVFLNFVLNAQVSVKWAHNFYTGSGVFHGVSIVNDSKNRVYSTGNNGNAYIIKFNETTGARKWYDSIPGTDAVKLKCDPNGFIYLIATYHNGASSYDDSDVLIAKYDSLGTKLWQTIYNDSLNFGDYPIDLEFDATGNIVLVANTENNSNQFGFRNNITLLKYSSSGALLWKRLYGNATGNSEFSYDIVLDNNANTYLAGSTTQVSGNPDFLVQKFDMNGIPTWSFTLNNNTSWGSHVDVAHRIAINKSNEIIASGIVENPVNGTSGLSYTAKFNLSGTKIWEKKISNGHCKETKHLHVDNKNNIFIAVNADSVALYGHIVCKIDNQGIVKKITASDNLGNSGAFDDYTIAGAYSDKYSNLYVTGFNGQQLLRDCYVIKYDSLGNKKWKYFYSAQGSNHEEEGGAVCVDSLENIFVTGYNSLSGQSYEKMLNLKLCQIKDFCGLTGVSTQSVSFSPKSVASFKFNNDSYYDLVYCDSLNKTLNVYLGGSNNTFSFSTSYTYTWTPNDIIAEDLNNDGFRDLILHDLTDDKIAVIFCTGNSTLSTPVLHSSSPGIGLVLAKDFNNDNKIDLFTLSSTQNMFSILINSGSGNFNAPVNTSHSSAYNSVALGDINNDAYTDVVASGNATNLIYKYINSGSQSFSSSFVSSSVFMRIKLFLEKFDGDANSDIAEVVSNGSSKFYKGDGLGNFSGGINPLTISLNISDVVSADYNNDGKNDLLFADKYSNSLKMYLNNLCTNTLQSYASYSLNMTAGKLTNLDMGGFSGVINTLLTNTNVAIWSNNCPFVSSSGIVTDMNEPENKIDFTGETSFLVYPNPSSDKIICNFSSDVGKAATLDIVNVVGKIVFHTPIGTTGQVTIVMKDLTSGVYFVRLNDSSTHRVVKIVKMD